MISLDDCYGLCGLTEDEVLALAEHEHVPEIIASALAQNLLCLPDGCRRIGAMIADDINAAQAHGDPFHAADLRVTLRQFVTTHPQALASSRAQACLNSSAHSAA